MAQSAIKNVPVIKVTGECGEDTRDRLAIEEPLEIRLEYSSAGHRIVKNVSVTMRTPGDDLDLALGFLFTEGIVQHKKDIKEIGHTFIACAENKENVILVSLQENVSPALLSSERNFYTTSSCGVCGKGSINAIRTVSAFSGRLNENNTVSAETLYNLPDILRRHQEVFAATGGLHGCALISRSGELLLAREDVGRHNALDKLIGASLKKDWLPLDQHVLLLSGRASFELVQKAAMAGITIIAAVGAPSSLAVELANEFNITLVGFLRGRRFNIYTEGHRILIPVYETTDQK